MSESSRRLWEGREDGSGFFLFHTRENTTRRLRRSKGGNVEQVPPSVTFLTSASTGPAASWVSLPLHSLLEETVPASILLCPGKSSSSLSPVLTDEELRAVQHLPEESHHPVAPGSSPGGGDELRCLVLLPCGKGEVWEAPRATHQSTEISSKAGKMCSSS